MDWGFVRQTTQLRERRNWELKVFAKGHYVDDNGICAEEGGK